MFKICSATPFDVKMHFTSTVEIAKEVQQDLESRYGLMLAELAEDNECMWDPGGMMMANDKIYNLHLAEITIMCHAQHYNFFIKYIQQCEPRGIDTKYVKIHGQYFCICISVAEFEQLKKLMCNAARAVEANEAAVKREKKINNLVESGHVVRVVKSEDGKLYKAVSSNSSNTFLKHLH